MVGSVRRFGWRRRCSALGDQRKMNHEHGA